MPHTDPNSGLASSQANEVKPGKEQQQQNEDPPSPQQLQQEEQQSQQQQQKNKKKQSQYPLALPLILQAVRVVFTGPGDDIGKLPSAERFAQCDLTTMEMLSMTGKERREVLKEYGVSPTQMIYFIRALQHVCTANSLTMVRDNQMALHQRRSSSTWTAKMDHHDSINESLLGRPIVLTTESDEPAAEKNSKNKAPTAHQPPKKVPASGGINAEEIRAQTGCVGLRNQGATCYLNSLLQSLYHIPSFRKSIYEMPCEEDDFKAQTKSIPLALQCLFYNLETSPSTCETTELTASFGWTARDTVIQHDVHELTRIMLDNLEEKMKKCGLPNAVKDMFGGEMENWIQVDDANYRSSRIEPIYDMQVVVKDCKNIYESFDKLFEVEVLEGSNAYCLERDGQKSYHRAERGISITKLPSVLILHLTRFDFDYNTGDMKKVMSRWDFYDTIDLKKYLPKKAVNRSMSGIAGEGDGPSTQTLDSQMSLTADTDENCEYKLHSVLVHSGSDSRFGHYYCFTKVGDKWYKFNDDNVSQATSYETFGCNFGGNTINYWGAKVPKIANGYMLVYIKKSDLEKVLTPITEDDHPKVLKQWIEEQREEEERIRKEKLEEHLYVKMWVMGADDIRRDHKRLSIPCINKSMLETRHPIRHKKTDTLEDAEQEIAEITGIPPERQQYWAIDYRGMHYRIQKHLKRDTKFENCCIKQDYRSSHECVLYVVDTNGPFYGSKREDAEVLLTHHKIYDPSSSSIIYAGSIPIGGGVATHTSNLESKVRELVTSLAEKEDMDCFFTPFDASDELEVLLEPEEGGNVVASPTVPVTGDIFIWQRKFAEEPSPDPTQAADGDKKEEGSGDSAAEQPPPIPEKDLYEYPTVQDYKHFLTHRVTISVFLNQPDMNFPKQFDLTMAYDSDYEKVQKKIASELTRKGMKHLASTSQLDQLESSTATNNKVEDSSVTDSPSKLASSSISSPSPAVDWRHVLLASYNPDTRTPYFLKPKKKEKLTLKDLLIPLKSTRMEDKLYFEIHEYTVEELESHNPLHFEFFNENVKSQGNACLLFQNPPGLFVKDVLKKCAERCGLSDPQPPLRLVDIWRGRLYTIYADPEVELTTPFEERAEYHIEISPTPLQNVPEDKQVMINVGHVNRASNFTPNNPKYNYHGDPFSLWIAVDDLAEDVMDRIALKLDMATQAIADWKPMMTIAHNGYELDFTKPVAQQYQDLFKQRPQENDLNFYFALEHAPMVGGRRGNRRVDQSLKISN